MNIIKLFGGAMLAQIVNKHRRAASVVKTALINAGKSEHSVCVSSNNKHWLGDPRVTPANNQEYAIFICSTSGTNTEPYYETGERLAEVVKKMINAIKGKKNAKSDDQSEIAPF